VWDPRWANSSSQRLILWTQIGGTMQMDTPFCQRSETLEPLYSTARCLVQERVCTNNDEMVET
jgi:hypothetical protein